MAQYEVKPEMMNQTAKDIGVKIEEWNNAVTAIYNAHKELDASFDGTANDTLNQIMAESAPLFKQMSELMVEYNNSIVKNSQTYASKDIEAADAIANSK